MDRPAAAAAATTRSSANCTRRPPPRPSTWPPPPPRRPAVRALRQGVRGKALAAAAQGLAAAQGPPRPCTPTRDDGIGGGAYADSDVTDEFYWAAAELYLTTGREAVRRTDVLASPVHTGRRLRRPAASTGPARPRAGRLDLATVPSGLPGRRQGPRSRSSRAPTRYLATLAAQPYGMPYAPDGNRYVWGSNHQVLNNVVVLATAYDLTGAAKYRDGALQSMDYILGRNALNISYVTGYGEVSSQNQHSRWYAHQLDPNLPNPPRGHPRRRAELGHPGPVRAEQAPGLRRPVLLHRRHPVLLDQRARDQLELGAGLDGVLRGGSGLTRGHRAARAR